MNAVDTNVVTRYLTHDDVEQFDRAAHLIESEPVLLLTSVILETAWVLSSAYRLKRAEVVRQLEAFARLPTVVLAEPEVVWSAFDLISKGVDFADAIHLASAREAGAFITFDRALIRAGAGSAVDVREP